jgi:hypothetical protein
MSVGLAWNGSRRTSGGPDMPSGPSELVPGAERSSRVCSSSSGGKGLTVPCLMRLRPDGPISSSPSS